MALSDDVIRAAVKAGRYNDPRAEQFLADALIERRDKIGRAWLTSINPIVDPALADDGTLTFQNPAVEFAEVKVAALRAAEKPSRRGRAPARSRAAAACRSHRSTRSHPTRLAAPPIGRRSGRVPDDPSAAALGRRTDRGSGS